MRTHARRHERSDAVDGRGQQGPTAPPAAAILRLQRQAGNRAVVAALQREATKTDANKLGATTSTAGAPTVAVIGPAPKAIPPGGTLPKATPGESSQPLGDTQIEGSTVPSFDIVPAPGPSTDKKSYAAKVKPAETASIRIAAQYPASGLFSFGSGKVVVDKDVSDLVRAGEQEHSNDFHLAFHAVYGIVGRAIDGLAGQPPKTGKDREAVRAAWRKALCDALPQPLRSPAGEDVNRPWIATVSKLYEHSRKRDADGWHSMTIGPGTPKQRAEHNVAKSVDFYRVIPGGKIGKVGSQERIDALVPGLKKTKP